ncbi:MAG TPA: hypothetical protein VKR42_07295 [Ktedonobacteraceae bacterium]|nr:hypothetical protein [Ktedonobacteraceae bacterium]
MPKKTATARNGAQRNKPKVQKSVELVRKVSNVSDEQEIELSEGEAEETPASSVSVAVDEAPPITRKRVRASSNNSSLSSKSADNLSNSESVAGEEVKVSESTGVSNSNKTPGTPPKGSAAARLVARRQAANKSQQRAVASMITAEHYSYVVKDLRLIAILAAIMLLGIIILQFVPGIGS